MQTISNYSLCIKEEIIEIDNPSVFKYEDAFLKLQEYFKKTLLIKCNIVKTTRKKIYFNVVSLDGIKGFLNEPFKAVGCKTQVMNDERCATCLIIPTGVGASIGGYAGDANPLAKSFAAESDYLITHPNVVNGAVLSDPPPNMIYLEGFLLDQFLLGQISLTPNKQNKIGVIFDKSISEDRLEYEVNVLNALKAFYGCEIIGWTLTNKPLNVTPKVNKYGFSSGSIDNLDSLIDSAVKLKDLGATAIAICAAVPDLDLNDEYILGKGIDPIGGVESLISRTVSAVTGLVSAHAPALETSGKWQVVSVNKNISPVSAAEYIAPTFLPSVISGLRFAPIITTQHSRHGGQAPLNAQHLNDVVVPYNAFGSPGVLYLNEVSKNVSLVKENKTCLDVDLQHINAKFSVVESYSDLINNLDTRHTIRPLEKIDFIS